LKVGLTQMSAQATARSASRMHRILEVAGVFRSNTVEDAIESLLLAGIDRADIDVRDELEAIERNPGRILSHAKDLPYRPRVPRRAFVDRIDSAVILSIVAWPQLGA